PAKPSELGRHGGTWFSGGAATSSGRRRLRGAAGGFFHSALAGASRLRDGRHARKHGSRADDALPLALLDRRAGSRPAPRPLARTLFDAALSHQVQLLDARGGWPGSRRMLAATDARAQYLHVLAPVIEPKRLEMPLPQSMESPGARASRP